MKIHRSFMSASFAVLVALAFFEPVAATASTCSGADPAITSVSVKDQTSNGSITDYTISGTVVNLGRKGQASNVLQFVDIFEHGIRRDSKSILPLRAGQSAYFTYVYSRSSDAGAGTAHLRFTMRFRNPSPPGSADCNSSNDTARLTF
ncbi:MAG TPA: hypothetical protein VGR69_09575 [Candidatus Rubrimentiphilum sp.]|nr:hypothetical protein [Candidatus Rubrimentiphilum sp.]